MEEAEKEELGADGEMNKDGLWFDEDELSIIRELLSGQACGYERETYYHHCCDAREVVEKIDNYLEKVEK